MVGVTREAEIRPDFNTSGTLDETPKNQVSAGRKVFKTAGATRPKTLKLTEISFSKNHDFSRSRPPAGQGNINKTENRDFRKKSRSFKVFGLVAPAV